jgi:hypothetical protein
MMTIFHQIKNVSKGIKVIKMKQMEILESKIKIK